MEMTSRAGIVTLLAAGLVFAYAQSGSADPPRSVSSYYLARGDPRLCPSPICGGLWVKLVNKGVTTCGDGKRRQECYAADADLSRLPVDEKDRVLLRVAITEGRALARGSLVPGRIEGFPELDTLVVSEVWTASSSLNRARGVFHRLRDRGVRCVTTPCFSTHAAALNSGRHVNLSEVDLSRTGAPAAERRSALEHLSHLGLIVAGRVVADPQDGPAGTGRTYAATQFYTRADTG
jgi:Domain of unknown function (DUF6748)